MKKLSSLALLILLAPFCYGKEQLGKVCLNIPERGLETVKIENTCKKGDIIMLNQKHVAYLCDFNSAVVNFNEYDKYACVYLGQKRELREGSND
ncbi:MAG: hypothetical protein ACU85E_02370 [Gammaproteobacteria bacterium]